MKKLFGLIVVCFSLSTVVFAEETKKVDNTAGPQITAPAPQACDLCTLREERQKLIDQKKEIIGKINAVQKQIKHCKGPGKVTKKLMEESELHEKTPM